MWLTDKRPEFNTIFVSKNLITEVFLMIHFDCNGHQSFYLCQDSILNQYIDEIRIDENLT